MRELEKHCFICRKNHLSEVLENNELKDVVDPMDENQRAEAESETGCLQFQIISPLNK
jgi:hypothetical protein